MIKLDLGMKITQRKGNVEISRMNEELVIVFMKEGEPLLALLHDEPVPYPFQAMVPDKTPLKI